MRRPINSSLSPNTESDDILRAITALGNPVIWGGTDALQSVRDWFTRTYGSGPVYLVNSGRSGLYLLLRAFGIGPGDDVLVQAFTCVAVPNSVLWCGAVPVYVDIDDSLNMDVRDLERKLTKQTRAVIIQHTFGFPAQMERIRAFCHKHTILLIEDCAHALGASSGGRLLGTWGDAAFFSFGRDKVVSSVFGGAAMINARHPQAVAALARLHRELPQPGFWWTLRQLLHPLAFAVILPTYLSGLGKALLVGLQKLGLLSFPVYPLEKRGGQPADFPAAYPNALAYLLELQLSKLERFVVSRRRTAAYYRVELAKLPGCTLPSVSPESGYLRFPVRLKTPDALMRFSRRRGILLGNWYRHVVDPAGVDLEAVRYRAGTCPAAEAAVQEMVNLPTLISEAEAEQVVAAVRDYVNTHRD